MDLSLRNSIAHQYISGDGIEIGALHSPLGVPCNAKVRYLDRMPVEQLRQMYPELLEYELVEIDIVDDGEALTSVSNSSVDFVIANHMIEHCQNPIHSLDNWLRVIKSGGIIYMAVPDKRYTFDQDRPVTTLEHLIRDYKEGPEWSMESHFEEWARLVDKKLSKKDIFARVKHLTELNYSIHFHVWTPIEFLELLIYCRCQLSLPFEIELIQKNGLEFIVVLKKTN
ncbi:MAG: class I SAM-dependent methyltransferase [Symploca sp. SIO2B6]|nr:class I SAM-dependent methyltransferase [Symploca sp. SIO2B6]